MNTHLLAIDFGTKHLGLAVATSPIADPLETVSIDHFWQKLDRLLEEYTVTAIVIGMSENKMAKHIQDFAREVHQHTALPIYFQDETLSSQETRMTLSKLGAKQKKLRNKIDHLVAASILQEFIDTYAALDQVPIAATMR